MKYTINGIYIQNYDNIKTGEIIYETFANTNNTTCTNNVDCISNFCNSNKKCAPANDCSVAADKCPIGNCSIDKLCLNNN